MTNKDQVEAHTDPVNLLFSTSSKVKPSKPRRWRLCTRSNARPARPVGLASRVHTCGRLSIAARLPALAIVINRALPAGRRPTLTPLFCTISTALTCWNSATSATRLGRWKTPAASSQRFRHAPPLPGWARSRPPSGAAAWICYYRCARRGWCAKADAHGGTERAACR